MKKILMTLAIALATATGAMAITYNDAAKQDKPIVIMFHMHGCGACKSMSPVFDKIADKYASKFNFVKEDINGSSIASSYKFDTVPSFFIVKPNKSSKRISYECASDDACFNKALSEYK